MRKYIILYFIVFACGLLYLAIHSVVTLDEVMLLDPCLNFLSGHYNSKIWYAPGSELVFMSYLPANFLFRILFLYLFPHQLFFYRLPYILLFMGSGILLYSIVQKRYHQPLLSVITAIFFLNDKGLWDASLSGRTETIQVFLILSYFYLELKNSGVIIPILKGFVIGLLFLTHPPAWIVATVFMWYAIDLKQTRRMLLTLLPVVLIIILFILSIHFNIKEFAAQLFLEGSLSSPAHSFGYRFIHFGDRFLPYPYLMQPWVLLILVASAYFWLNISVVKSKWEQSVGIVFFSYLIFLLITSENYSRYNPPLLVCTYLFLPFIINYIQVRLKRGIPKYLYLIVILLVSIPFMLRVSRAYSNRDSNDAKQVVVQFLEAIHHQSNESILIIGEPIGYFVAKTEPGLDYTTPFTTHKFKDREYDRQILISYQEYTSNAYHLISKIEILNTESGTYQGLNCYERISTSVLVPDK